MDPNATLETLRKALDALDASPDGPDASEHATDIIEAARALDFWMSHKGFLPDAWRA